MGWCLAALKLLCIPLLIRVLTWCVRLCVGWDRSPTCLVGKTTIVTGANTGIGFHTALDFAKRGARVILACRDKDKAEQAKTKIIEATGNSNVVVRLVDFSSLGSVREFAKEINETEERLDILVNNAGVAGLKNTSSGDGLNLLMQINYFGPFLLTLLLIDLLKKSTPSRIINVSSAAAYWAKLDPDNLATSNSHTTLNYSNSKLCNILFTNELARKLEGSGVVANSLHPGVVKTDIFRKVSGFRKLLFKLLANTTFKTSEEGAQTTIYVAVSKDLEGVSGKYFDNCRIAWLPAMPKPARDEGLARKVWEKSVEMVKLSVAEQRL